MSRKFLFLFALVVGCAHPGAPSASRAVTAAPQEDRPTAIQLESSLSAIDIGASTTVTVTVADARNLYSAEVKLAFDARHLRVIDAEPASDGVQARPLAELLRPEWVVKNHVDNEIGAVWYVVSQLRPTKAVTGTGGVLAIDFMGWAPGSSTIAVADFALLARDGQHIEAVTRPVEVGVRNEGSLPPSPTPQDGGGPAPTPTMTETTDPPPSPSPTRTAVPVPATQTARPPTATPPPTRTPRPPSPTPIEPRPTEPRPTPPSPEPTPDSAPIYLPFSYRYRR
jgi:hypothetical protein